MLECVLPSLPYNEQLLNKLLTTLHERFAINTGQVDTASRLSDIGMDTLHLVDIMFAIMRYSRTEG